jgi:hypothetical protein
MGLLGDMFGGGRMKDPTSGTAQVVSCSANRGRGVWQNCHMELVVQADDVPATAVEFQGLVHRQRWPTPGMTLPATIDRTDPRRVKIEWDEMTTSRERSHETAEGLAAAMRGEGGGQAAGGLGALGGANVVNLSGRDFSDLTEEQKQKLRMLGVDPDALAASQGQAPPDRTKESDSDEEMDDRLGQLERLTKLHEQGALTDAEFEAQKAQILGS